MLGHLSSNRKRNIVHELLKGLQGSIMGCPDKKQTAKSEEGNRIVGFQKGWRKERCGSVWNLHFIQVQWVRYGSMTCIELNMWEVELRLVDDVHGICLFSRPESVADQSARGKGWIIHYGRWLDSLKVMWNDCLRSIIDGLYTAPPPLAWGPAEPIQVMYDNTLIFTNGQRSLLFYFSLKQIFRYNASRKPKKEKKRALMKNVKFTLWSSNRCIVNVAGSESVKLLSQNFKFHPTFCILETS